LYICLHLPPYIPDILISLISPTPPISPIPRYPPIHPAIHDNLGNSDSGALSTFTFSGDYHYSKPFTMETTMTEADFSGKALGASGCMMVAAFLPKCQ
jgi:hypothetical protein